MSLTETLEKIYLRKPHKRKINKTHKHSHKAFVSHVDITAVAILCNLNKKKVTPTHTHTISIFLFFFVKIFQTYMFKRLWRVEGMMTQEKKGFFSKTKSFFSCWKPILNLRLTRFVQVAFFIGLLWATHIKFSRTQFFLCKVDSIFYINCRPSPITDMTQQPWHVISTKNYHG